MKKKKITSRITELEDIAEQVIDLIEKNTKTTNEIICVIALVKSAVEGASVVEYIKKNR